MSSRWKSFENPIAFVTLEASLEAHLTSYLSKLRHNTMSLSRLRFAISPSVLYMPKFLPFILARSYSNSQSQSLFIHNVNGVCLIQPIVSYAYYATCNTLTLHATKMNFLGDLVIFYGSVWWFILKCICNENFKN